MSDCVDRLKLKEKAEEDRYFAGRDASLLAARRDRAGAASGALARVVSGGQTGVDRAALDAARALGIGIGGWCPRGRVAEDGVIPEVYPLCETTSADVAQRTEWNVRDSDATLVLHRAALSGGTATTVEHARRLGRPLLVRDLDTPIDPAEVVTWLVANQVRVLNCAGPRASEAPEIEAQARQVLTAIFARWLKAGG